MRFHMAPAAAVFLFSCAPFAFAQTSTAEDDRINRLEQRFNQLETQYQSDLKSRDAEIARLKAQIASQPASTPEARAEQLRSGKLRILDEIDSDEAVKSTQRTPASFNPDFAVVADFHANVSSDNANKARNRFDIGSVELDLRAPVDPRADAVVVLPFTRDVEDPLFFNAGDPQGGPDNGTEVEEAYLLLHDFGVPNLTIKLGRFHLRFGRDNILHSHDWPTVDNSFVNQSFLGPESLTDSGASFSYVIPNPWNEYFELVTELVSGEGDDSPTLNNDSGVQSPAINTHLLWNHDLTPYWNLELGASFLAGKHNSQASQDVRLYGGDVTLIHTDPTGGFNNQLFQAEMIYGDTETSDTTRAQSLGAYVLAQQQLDRDWYTGIRLDWTQDALDDKREVWGVSPYLTWYWSEFLRFRLQYQHKDGDVTPEDSLFLQVTFIFGAHPPHPYWAMK